MLKDWIGLARPRDWVKSVFIFMPVPFALADGATFRPTVFATGVAAFCLASSAVYALNDAFDAKLDRSNPRTKNRPVASGRISEAAAYAFSALLALGSLGLGWTTGLWAVPALIGTYLLLNVIYSAFGKHVSLVDVFLLSSGFVIRVFLGCVLLAVAASNWLLLCTSTLALFMALTKRRADLVMGMDAAQRPSLAGYNLPFLDQAMGITAGTALLAYALYSIESQFFRPGREFASLPFVAFVILNYLRLAHTEGKGGSPVDLALREPSFLVAGMGWAAAAAWSLGIL